MHSINFYVWEFLAARGFKKIYAHCPDAVKMRQAIKDNSKFFDTLDPRSIITPVENAPFDGEWIRPKSGQARVTVLYLHGGYFLMGNPESFRSFLTYFAARANVNILAVDYPLAPEYPYPHAIETTHKAYQWLLNKGTNPEEIVLAGDSAGGGLTLSLLQSIRAHGEPMPASAICLCPFLNQNIDVNGLPEALKNDKFLSAPVAELAIKCYVNGSDKLDPMVSPMYADLTGFPPIFLQTGTGDALYEQAEEFSKRAKHQNCKLTFDVWDDMPHDWQVIMGSNVKESREAIDNICTFLNSTTSHVKQKAQTAQY